MNFSKKNNIRLSLVILVAIIASGYLLVNKNIFFTKADQVPIDNFCDADQAGLVAQAINKNGALITGAKVEISRKGLADSNSTINGFTSIVNIKTIDQAVVCLSPGAYSVKIDTAPSEIVNIASGQSLKISVRFSNQSKYNLFPGYNVGYCKLSSDATNQFIVADAVLGSCVPNIDVNFELNDVNLLQSPTPEESTFKMSDTQGKFAIPKELNRTNIKYLYLDGWQRRSIRFLPSSLSGKFHIDRREDPASLTLDLRSAALSKLSSKKISVMLFGSNKTIRKDELSASDFPLKFDRLAPGEYGLMFATPAEMETNEDDFLEYWTAPGAKTIEILPGTTNRLEINSIIFGV